MAFRKKFSLMIKLEPELLVIQECENQEKLELALADVQYNELLWFGDNPHKGVGIISFGDLTIKISKKYNPTFRYIIPVNGSYKGTNFNLFAIWAMPDKEDKKKSYVGQIWLAINYYDKLLSKKCILIGDFNSNAIWDKKSRIGNHTDVVEKLANHKIVSLYHTLKKEKQGKEKVPTLYLLKQKDRPYHIDYCFVSSSFIDNNTSIVVGNYKDWIKKSDHVPLIIDNLKM